jgi:hypothetical protein
MAGHEDEESEWQALRDENDSLRQECQELRAENKEHDDFINEATGMLPPSYDGDEAPEAIILGFLKDMQKLAQIIAKLTADYRLS